MIALAGMMAAAAVAADPPAAADAPAPGPAAQGARVYARMCSRCHGADMVGPVAQAYDLRRFPPDDRARFVTSVTQGKGNMPPWAGVLTDQEIEALWAYVRAGSAGPP